MEWSASGALPLAEHVIDAAGNPVPTLETQVRGQQWALTCWLLRWWRVPCRKKDRPAPAVVECVATGNKKATRRGG